MLSSTSLYFAKALLRTRAYVVASGKTIQAKFVFFHEGPSFLQGHFTKFIAAR